MRPQEPFNALSHALGAVLIAPAVAALIALAPKTWPAIVGLLAFGVCALALYTASAIYHAAGEGRPFLQRLDHAAIYFMIAGSYLPVALLALAGALRWWVLGLQLGMATLGAGYSLLKAKTPEALRMTLYILMGWMALPLLGPIARGSSPAVVAWIAAGGLTYTFGAVVYATGRPRLWPGRFGSHELWHLFVLGGTACHLMMMRALVTGPLPLMLSPTVN